MFATGKVGAFPFSTTVPTLPRGGSVGENGKRAPPAISDGAKREKGFMATRGFGIAEGLQLSLFAALVAGGGLLIGTVTLPGDWYAQLAKPDFNPPGWVFGPVWTLLYILIAIAGWRVWQVDRAGWAMRLWWVQLGLNFAWSPAFFYLHRIGLALVILAGLLAAVIGFIAAAWYRHRLAACLFLPYAAWVAFAGLLNASILALN